MTPAEQPRLLLVAGPNGAGKTTVTERCLAERRSLAFESVFSAPDKVDFVRRAQTAGFFTRVFFVGTGDPSINAARVARRVMQGGHDVPIQKIIARHFRSIANCALIAREVDRLYLYDNSVDGEQATLVLRASKGVVVRQYCPSPEWMAPIIEVLDHS